uniref:Phospholipase A2-like central domain-containing protein n=1 Tax=Pseudonaja textilis TaxID=8673 RepID=A0A670ZCF3_PSETE
MYVFPPPPPSVLLGGPKQLYRKPPPPPPPRGRVARGGGGGGGEAPPPPPPPRLQSCPLMPHIPSSPITGHPLGKAPSRPRRGILQLAGMIQCTTGRTPLAYIRYGCYCGWGGRGWPKDQVDWCCFKHDCCYGKAEEENCAPKMRGYPWECQDSKAKCGEFPLRQEAPAGGQAGRASPHPGTTAHLLGRLPFKASGGNSKSRLHCLLISFPFADDIGDKCQKMACECDRDAAKCLAKAPYNVTLLFWPDSRCAEKGPTCADD